ncbi:hypothetical protein IAU60_000281 [Kwoniella sp. DSM 27419]
MADAALSFKLLSILSKERAVYGLRNGDHERYRRHCANKIHRLRQVTGSTCGKGKTYKTPAKVDASGVKDVRQLQLLVFSAERALAHSHELKAQRAKPQAAVQQIKKEQISWLRRSLKLSTELFDIACELSKGTPAQLSQRTLTEITVYHLTIRSELAFERNNFIDALSDLAARRSLLGVLARSAKDSYDEALANEFIDSHDPLIRYCAYKLGRADSHDIDGVMADVTEDVMVEALPIYSDLVRGLGAELGSEMEEGRKKLSDVTFAGEKIEFRNAELVQAMSKVQDTLASFDGGKGGKSMRGWDRVLAVLGEAEAVARRLVEDHEASGSSTSLRSAEVSQSLSLAHGYIIYLLLSHRFRRDLQLIDVLTASFSSHLPADIKDLKIRGGRSKVEKVVKGLAGVIKLLDTALQSLRGIAEVSLVQEKEGVRVGVEGLEAYHHAYKCFQLARLHCLHPTPSYASAISLVDQAATLQRQSLSLLVDPPVPIEEPIITVSQDRVDAFEADIQALDAAAKNALFGQTVDKPIFFDMAFNYIDIPFDELEVLGGKKQAQPKAASAVPAAAVVAESATKAAQVVADGADRVVERVKKVTRETRESTPGPAEEEQASADQGKKGWLGGWFGRGK